MHHLQLHWKSLFFALQVFNESYHEINALVFLAEKLHQLLKSVFFSAHLKHINTNQINQTQNLHPATVHPFIYQSTNPPLSIHPSIDAADHHRRLNQPSTVSPVGVVAAFWRFYRIAGNPKGVWMGIKPTTLGNH